MNERTLTALATKAIAGDTEAFEKLYFEHARSILFHVRSLIIDKENYYDVAQDVVLQMFTHIKQLKEPAAFRAWMHQVIRTSCAMHNRSLLSANKYVSTGDDEQVLEELADEQTKTDPEAITMAKLEGNTLFAIISDLSANYREILVQRYYDDLSYKEIAEAQGISVTNVSTRLQRATEAMRKKLGEMGEEYAALGREVTMKDDTRGITTEREVGPPADTSLGEEIPAEVLAKEAGDKDVVFDEGESLKSSLLLGVAMLTPDELVKEFAGSVNAKLVGVGTVAAATGGAAAASFFGKWGAKLLTVLLSTAVVAFAVGVSSVAYTTVIDVPGGEIKQEKSVDYSGTVRLSFVDEDGNDSSRNIVSATVIEDTPAAVETSWNLYQLAGDPSTNAEADASNTAALLEGSTLLASGSGSSIEGPTLTSLSSGYYLLVFTLTDGNAATAEVKRSFIITR